MKQIIVLLTIILIPVSVQAAWWNPFSWVQKSKVVEQAPAVQNIEPEKPVETATTSQVYYTTFFVKYDNSRLRKCPSTDCEVMGYYHTNAEMRVPGKMLQTWDDLPEWLDVAVNEDIGYLHRTVLSEKPVQAPVVNNSMNVKVMKEWLALVDEYRIGIIERASSMQSDIGLEVFDTYNKQLYNIRKGMVAIIESGNYGDDNSQKFRALVDAYKLIPSRVQAGLKMALEYETLKSETISRELESKRAYERAQDRLDTANQARIDATNDYVSKYQEIMDNAKREGLTQSVVNGQLNAAGLIKTTNCYGSSVGGMTPGAGSVTCYTQ